MSGHYSGQRNLYWLNRLRVCRDVCVINKRLFLYILENKLDLMCSIIVIVIVIFTIACICICVSVQHQRDGLL